MIDTNAVRFGLAHRLNAIRDAVDHVNRLVMSESNDPLTLDAARVATDLADALVALRTVTTTLITARDAVPYIDPYGEDDWGSLETPSEDRDRATSRGPVIAVAPADAPSPVTHGHRAFGSSNRAGIAPDNPFANLFAKRGQFGYVDPADVEPDYDPSQIEQETYA